LKKQPVILALFLIGALCLPAFAINGVMSEADGQRVMHVWGTNYEMGYAHGFLLGEEVLQMMELYIFPIDAAGLAEYEWKKDFVQANFDFPPKLLDEAQGMFDGMIDAGVSTFSPILGRYLTLEDQLLAIATRDLAGLLCTTVIGWDSATVNDPDLEGRTLAGHNTDFRYQFRDPYFAGAHGVIVAYSPSDPDYQRFVAATFPGFLGIVSGINEAGVGLFTNRGAYWMSLDEMILDPKRDVGVWSTREALSLLDVDQDGEQTIDDILVYYDDVLHFGSLLVQVFSPADRGDPPAAVLEINNHGRAVRYPEEDPDIGPDMIVALNWEDKIMPNRQVLHELRYQQQVQILVDEFHKEISVDRVWDYLYRNRGQFPISVTFQTMLYLPEEMRLGVFLWTEEDDVPAENNVWYDFEDLFLPHPADDDDDDDDNDDTDWHDNPPDDDSSSEDDDGDDGDGDNDEAPAQSAGNDGEGGCGC